MAYNISYQATVISRLRTAISTALSGTFGGRVYWQIAPQGATLPYCVFQSQDAGGKRDDYVGENGWTGLITLRVLDDDQDAADELLALLPALLQGIDGLTFVAGRPLVVSPEEYPDKFIFTAALIGEATLGE
jgi:hypothetical protein